MCKISQRAVVPPERILLGGVLVPVGGLKGINPPFSCLSDLMKEAGKHGKDLATTLILFVLAGFVPFSPWPAPLLVSAQPAPRQLEVPPLTHGLEKKQSHPWAKWGWGWPGRTLLHSRAQGRRAWAGGHSDRMADCHPLQSGNTWISRLDAVLGTQAWLLTLPEVCHNFHPCPLSFAFTVTALLYTSCKRRHFCPYNSLTTASCICSLFFPLYLTLFSISSWNQCGVLTFTRLTQSFLSPSLRSSLQSLVASFYLFQGSVSTFFVSMLLCFIS